MSFFLTPKQEEALTLLSGPQRHVCLEGGSRSGKTFLLVRQLCVRALKAPKSRHAVLRWKFKHVKESVGMDTFPAVMSACWPGYSYELNKSDWCAYFHNGAELWFGGLDDKERTEKILGKEFASIYLNEASQIGFNERNMAITRLAQKVQYEMNGESRTLRQKMFYDLNPPSKGHWVYQMFHMKRMPDTRRVIPDSDNYAWMKMNPRDNAANLTPEYMRELENLPERLRRRFWLGEYGELAPGALWDEETIDRWRSLDDLPAMVRIVVSVDPSGSEDDEDNDEHDDVGIIVMGLGEDGNGYVLEDLTVNAGPTVWGKVVCDAYDRWDADSIVGETNFGGGMVSYVVKTQQKKGERRHRFKKVTSSRGKTLRAEPVSVLWHDGRMRMSGYHDKLEDEMLAFTDHGYTGIGSPNRVDAMVFAATELFPRLIRGEQKSERKRERVVQRSTIGGSSSGTRWMG